MVAKNKLSAADTFIKNVVEKPQVFFDNNPKLVEQSIALTKHFYDSAKEHETESFSPFTELLTEGFDHDQIWEELCTQNEPFITFCESSLSQFAKLSHWTDDQRSDSPASDQSEDEAMYDVPADDSDMQASEDDVAMDDLDEDLDDSDEQDDEDELEMDEEDADEQEEDQDESDAPNKASEVDDEFFNLESFNKWTEEQEELDMMSDHEDDDDEIDYDNDLDGMDDDDDELLQAADLTYKDFFVAPKKRKNAGPRKQVSFKPDDNEDDMEDAGLEDDEASGDEDDLPTKTRNLFDDEEELDQVGQEKSKFQRQQDRIQEQIDQFEQENIEGRHWTLKGEASAKARPINSLLEEDLEFDHSAKPVPVITQDVTNALEDLIKLRIKENNFDDVERKQDPTLRPFLPSKRVELQDTASKKSLAELYEDEYVKTTTSNASNEKDEALAKEHEEIKSMFQTLCYKLDALSNFHFTPKQAQPELTVVSNAASISMEEVIPVNVSDATLLAPEEVYDKPAVDVKDRSEMDQAERKRARKVKKVQKRKDRALKEKERQLLHPNAKVNDRQAKTNAVKELMGQKNVTMIGKDGKQMKKDKKIASASLFS
ncbi:Mpp10 protein [Hesseltinella vesiculosa]|uniref:U3 small nucleolar ribonucleoprotein protein MPP10 n=1 Tax=Hesseltinella vesiculosa TaxID=101127 RepID=A0A1X2G2R7_9FUNG|nr:Mpp10 protein [Hesseltinella vesiculosa]